MLITSRLMISLCGLSALWMIIWLVGPHIKFGSGNSAPLSSATSRLLLILVIFIFWGLYQLWKYWRTKKNNKQLVDDLQDSQAEPAQDMTAEMSAEELQQINERFAQALTTLKNLKFNNRSKHSNKALYELPWYIIIGPPGSGKTTALINSGLDFPLAEQFGKNALQGVGGTRNCDWWFTNDAVLIDTAGRYTTQDSHRVLDSSGWEGFLNLLKRNRRRRPINGVIVAVSLQDLMIQSEEERNAHAKTIRTRIDELMEKLEIRFPVYLMFTKADLVSGFMEFFEDLNKQDRDQVWGVTLPDISDPEQSPDFDLLSTEFKNLLTRIYDRVLWRIHQERDTQRRSSIQGFPRQIDSLQPVVDRFVRQTFIKNRYKQQPYLRGVYLCSGTQDGTPIDRLMSSVASDFGFDREAAQLPNQQGKSFFLSRLFREVIFPESELVGVNRRYENLMRWMQRGAYVGMAAVFVGLLLVWTGSVTQHKSYMREVESYIAEFNAENKRLNAWNNDVRVVLPPLNPLAKASIVYNQQRHPWLSGFGLYDSNVDTAADEAYAWQLQGLLLPRLMHYLSAAINQGHQGGDLYNTFRVYLMFNKLDYFSPDIIRDWFAIDWEQNLHGEATKRKELQAHLDALLEVDLMPTELNPALIRRTRQLLLRVPESQRVYSRIRTNPDYAQRVELLNQFGETVRDAYKMNPQVMRDLTIPVMFTIDGYENIDMSAESPVITDILNDKWVLTDDQTERVDFIQDDLKEISDQVRDHYFADYIRVWNTALVALEVDEFQHLKHASETLASFTDPVYSPLLSVLQVAKTHTQLTPPMIANLTDNAEQAAQGKSLTSRFQQRGFPSSVTDSSYVGTKVDKQFRALHLLLQESAKQAPPISGVMQKITLLQDFVDQISVSPDPTKSAFDIAKARYSSGAGNAITSLAAYAKNTPDPIKDWLLDLSDQTWKVVLGAARQYVNTEWRSRVYQPYRQGLAGRYPLSRSARDELALADFTEFFKPEGAADSFYQEFMRPFINTRRGWSNRVVDNRSMGFSSRAIAQVKKAQTIKTIFFQENPNAPSVTFQIKPSKMVKQDARFILEVGGKRISYQHGPKFWSSLQWPGEDDNNRVRAIFEDIYGQRHTLTYEGPWAWFRLQDQANLRSTSRSNVYMATYSIEDKAGSFGQAHRVDYEIKAKSVNNPFNKDLLSSLKFSENL